MFIICRKSIKTQELDIGLKWSYCGIYNNFIDLSLEIFALGHHNIGSSTNLGGEEEVSKERLKGLLNGQINVHLD